MTNETAIAILSELKKCYLGGIVDALDFAIETIKEQKSETSDAPKPDSDIGCWYDITHNYTLEQVVSALNVLEPRVMTLEEALHAPFAWTETRDGYMSIRRIRDIHNEPTNMIVEGFSITMVIVPKAKYGRFVRCWTSCPTKEKMEETPWN